MEDKAEGRETWRPTSVAVGTTYQAGILSRSAGSGWRGNELARVPTIVSVPPLKALSRVQMFGLPSRAPAAPAPLVQEPQDFLLLPAEPVPEAAAPGQRAPSPHPLAGPLRCSRRTKKKVLVDSGRRAGGAAAGGALSKMVLQW